MWSPPPIWSACSTPNLHATTCPNIRDLVEATRSQYCLAEPTPPSPRRAPLDAAARSSLCRTACMYHQRYLHTAEPFLTTTSRRDVKELMQSKEHKLFASEKTIGNNFFEHHPPNFGTQQQQFSKPTTTTQPICLLFTRNTNKQANTEKQSNKLLHKF